MSAIVPQRFIDALNDRFETLRPQGFDGQIFWSTFGEQLRYQLEPHKDTTAAGITATKGVRLHIPQLGHMSKIQRQHCGVLPPACFQPSPQFLQDYDLKPRNLYPRMPGWVRDIEFSFREFSVRLSQRSGGSCNFTSEETRRILSGVIDLVGSIAQGNVPPRPTSESVEREREMRDSVKFRNSDRMPLSLVGLPAVGSFVLHRRQLGFNFDLSPNPHLADDAHTQALVLRQASPSRQGRPHSAPAHPPRLGVKTEQQQQQEQETTEAAVKERNLLSLVATQSPTVVQVSKQEVGSGGGGNQQTVPPATSNIPPALLSITPNLSKARPSSATSSARGPTLGTPVSPATNAMPVGLPPRPSTAGSTVSRGTPSLVVVLEEKAPEPTGDPAPQQEEDARPTTPATKEVRSESDASRLTADVLRKLEESVAQSTQLGDRPELQRLGGGVAGGDSSYSLATKSSQLGGHPLAVFRGGSAKGRRRPQTAGSIGPSASHHESPPHQSSRIGKLRDLCAVTSSGGGSSKASSLTFSQQLIQNQRKEAKKREQLHRAASPNPHATPQQAVRHGGQSKLSSRFAEAKQRRYEVDQELAQMESYLLDKYKVPAALQQSMRQQGSLRREGIISGGSGSGDGVSIRHQSNSPMSLVASLPPRYSPARTNRPPSSNPGSESTGLYSLGMMGADRSPDRAHNQGKKHVSTHRRPPLAATTKVMSLALDRHMAKLETHRQEEEGLAQYIHEQGELAQEVDFEERRAKREGRLATSRTLKQQTKEREEIQRQQLYLGGRSGGGASDATSQEGGENCSSQIKDVGNVHLVSDAGALYQSHSAIHFPTMTAATIYEANPTTKRPLGLITETPGPPSQDAIEARKQAAIAAGVSKKAVTRHFVALTHSRDTTPFSNPKEVGPVLDKRWVMVNRQMANSKKRTKQVDLRVGLDDQVSVRRVAREEHEAQVAKEDREEQDMLQVNLVKSVLARREKDAQLREEQRSVWRVQEEEKARTHAPSPLSFPRKNRSAPSPTRSAAAASYASHRSSV